MSALLIRPATDAEFPVLVTLFRDSVAIGAAEYYDASQRRAWLSAADEEITFIQRLEDAATVIAVRDGEIQGFGSLEDDTIAFLYVHPRALRQGIGSALVGTLEFIALTCNKTRIKVAASDAAMPLFETLGYTARSRNTHQRAGGVTLFNTTMEKRLDAPTILGDHR